MKRVHVFISGKVHGVCFRSAVADNAMELGIKGFVKNVIDGRVEAVFEGEEDKVNKLIEFCKKGPQGARVEKVESLEEKYEGKIKGFGVL